MEWGLSLDTCSSNRIKYDDCLADIWHYSTCGPCCKDGLHVSSDELCLGCCILENRILQGSKHKVLHLTSHLLVTVFIPENRIWSSRSSLCIAHHYAHWQSLMPHTSSFLLLDLAIYPHAPLLPKTATLLNHAWPVNTPWMVPNGTLQLPGFLCCVSMQCHCDSINKGCIAIMCTIVVLLTNMHSDWFSSVAGTPDLFYKTRCNNEFWHNGHIMVAGSLSFLRCIARSAYCIPSWCSTCFVSKNLNFGTMVISWLLVHHPFCTVLQGVPIVSLLGVPPVLSPKTSFIDSWFSLRFVPSSIHSNTMLIPCDLFHIHLFHDVLLLVVCASEKSAYILVLSCSVNILFLSCSVNYWWSCSRYSIWCSASIALSCQLRASLALILCPFDMMCHPLW